VFATNNENEYKQLLLNGGEPFEGITLQPIESLRNFVERHQNDINDESSSDLIFDESSSDSDKETTK
jgi:hypothetical protein